LITFHYEDLRHDTPITVTARRIELQLDDLPRYELRNLLLGDIARLRRTLILTAAPWKKRAEQTDRTPVLQDQRITATNFRDQA
jgi:hypothetical protein